MNPLWYDLNFWLRPSRWLTLERMVGVEPRGYRPGYTTVPLWALGMFG